MILTLARKPLSEKNIVENVRKHGTGGLNIDDSRIHGPAWKWGTQTDIKGGGYGSKRPSEGDVYARDIESNPSGRWPANLILEHKPECQRSGPTLVKGVGGGGYSGPTALGQNSGWNKHNNRPTKNVRYVDENGMEEIESWDCVDGCPVLGLEDTTARFFKQIQHK